MDREAQVDQNSIKLNFRKLNSLKDQQVSGRVISIRHNMVYVKIEDHEWLVGRAYYPLTFDANQGDNVYCKVKKVDPENKEIVLVIQEKAS